MFHNSLTQNRDFFLERRLKLEEVYIFLIFCFFEEGDHNNGVADRRRAGKGFEFRWRDVLTDGVEITN